MKRSTHVAAPLLAAAALAMTTGCRRPQMQRCVDENNNVVADSFCKDLPNQQQNNNNLFPHTYRYYYGGWGGYGMGTRVGGGAYVPTPGASYTSRGGFGSSFAEGGSHASGGEGGGHGGGAGE
jgi:hypothetical protein